MSIMPRVACSVRLADYEGDDSIEPALPPPPLYEHQARYLFQVIAARLHSTVPYESYTHYFNRCARYHMGDKTISDIMEEFITGSTRHITLRKFLQSHDCPYTTDVAAMYNNWVQHHIFEAGTNRWTRMTQFWEENEFLLPKV